MTNIAVIGNVRVPTATEASYVYAFRKLGHTVIPITQDDACAHGPAWVFQQCENNNAELTVYTRTHNRSALGHGEHGPAQWTALWRRLEMEGVQTCSTHLDVFWGLQEREQWIADGDPLFTTGTVFTADGRASSAERFAAAGVNHRWLPPAIDERNLLPEGHEFREASNRPQIVWVGTSSYHACWPWRRELVGFLRATYGDRLVEYGSGSRFGVMRDQQGLLNLYSADTIVVGDSMFSDETPCVYLSDRVPEVLGRGGLLLHPRLDTSVGFPAWSTYAPLEQSMDRATVMSAIEEYEADWSLRRAVKRCAARVVRENHTYGHRARTVLEMLGVG